jgi:hypothetical protein
VIRPAGQRGRQHDGFEVSGRNNGSVRYRHHDESRGQSMMFEHERPLPHAAQDQPQKKL